MTEYYSPRAKKRWCLSLYENVGHHALGVFPQAAMVSHSTVIVSLFKTKKENPYGINLEYEGAYAFMQLHEL